MQRLTPVLACVLLCACAPSGGNTVSMGENRTFFTYDASELAELPRLRDGSIAPDVTQLLAWDTRIQDTIREHSLAPTEAARLYSTIAVGQRDAVLLGGMHESIDAIGAVVTCDLVPATCARMRSFYLQSDFDASMGDLIFRKLQEHRGPLASATGTTKLDISGMRLDFDPETPEAGSWTRWMDGEIAVKDPPAVGSTEELEDLWMVQDAVSTITEWQRQRILYWSAQPNRKTAVGVWIDIIGSMLSTHQRSLHEVATVRAAAGMAMHDALVTGWAAKERYNYPRPTQREVLPPIPALILIPATSAYPGEDGIVAGAAGNVLIEAFPEEALTIEDMQREAADTRVWAGANYRFSTREGLRIGEETAALVTRDDRFAF